MVKSFVEMTSTMATIAVEAADLGFMAINGEFIYIKNRH
jgi:hypothetical protein